MTYLVLSSGFLSFAFFALFAFFAVPLSLPSAGVCLAAEPADPGVRLYDTGMQSSDPLSGAAVAAAMAGWVQVPAADTTHKFKGDVAFGNERLVVVLRAKGYCAQVYPIGRHGLGAGNDLVPLVKANDGEVRHVTAFRIIENTGGAVAVEVTSTGPSAATFRLAVGQPYVEVRPGAGTVALFVGVWPQLILAPDFFGDDMVFAPDGYGRKSRLPAENFVLGLRRRGDMITMCVWQDRTAGAQAVEWENGMRPMFMGWRVDCIEGKSIWVAFLEGLELWCERSVPAEDAGKVLGWKPLLAAKWRADLIQGNGFAESVTFEWPPPAGGAMPTLKAGKYIIYPLDRTKATPLTEFTPVDILRNTLGVGPCQYILETEGLASADNPTPEQVMTWIEKQLKKKGGKDAADDVRERVKAMAELVGRTESRIKRYADFAAEMKQLLASDDSETGLKLKATADALAQAAAAGLAATEPPGRVAKLADAVAGLIGKDTAAADLAAPAAEVRSIGAGQDRALAKSRMAVRWLRCQARRVAEEEPRHKGLAAAIEARADAVLQGK